MKAMDHFTPVVEQVQALVGDVEARNYCRHLGLTVTNVCWEDTARSAGSAIGPNISDLTIQVQYRAPGEKHYRLACMPVVRFPNFHDLSCDISPELFYLLVGNQSGKPLEKITLAELLSNLRAYLHDPNSWAGDGQSMLVSERDSHVLVSAQACLLPIPRDGLVEFNPVLFNYQSRKGDPAVLAIVATREGTSITVIDNHRDRYTEGGAWGQRLFFNANGQRAVFTGRRKSDHQADVARQSGSTSAVRLPDGLNMVLLVQVPLKRKTREPLSDSDTVIFSLDDTVVCAAAPMEDAVIGHGPVEGPFTEIDGLPIERDERYPIRVTVQFYKATSTGMATEHDLNEIAAQIRRVYDQADYVGSLVTDPPQGRSTEHHDKIDDEAAWWDSFWKTHEANTGQTRAEAEAELDRLYGTKWRERPPSHLT